MTDILGVIIPSGYNFSALPSAFYLNCARGRVLFLHKAITNTEYIMDASLTHKKHSQAPQ